MSYTRRRLKKLLDEAIEIMDEWDWQPDIDELKKIRQELFGGEE